MSARNRVVAGDYNNKNVCCTLCCLYIYINFKSKILIDKSNVKRYDTIYGSKYESDTNTENKITIKTALLNIVNLLTAIFAKSNGIYLIEIEFNDKKTSILEIDEKRYKLLLKKLSKKMPKQ